MAVLTKSAVTSVFELAISQSPLCHLLRHESQTRLLLKTTNSLEEAAERLFLRRIMTENPIIPSTPGPSQPPSLANSTTTPEDVADNSGEIDCICEISDDDGFTICCDKCDTWQHLVCVQLNGGNVPKDYYCPRCSPRPLDVQKAKDIQRRRMEDEQAKKNHKKKRPAGSSHKKKELSNGTNGIASGKIPSSTEKTGVQGSGRSVGSKEMQQHSRKRGHRAPAQPSNNGGFGSSITHNTVLINVPNTNIPLEPSPARNGGTESDTDPEKPTRDLREGFTDVGNSSNKCTGTHAHKIGDCACSEGKECLVDQIKEMADGETVTSKIPNGNGNSRKQRRTNASTESTVGSKRPTPDCQSVPLKKEEDEEGRSVSPPFSRGKPRSRDLTPSMLQDVAVEKGEMTGREARKFKDVLSRIEKQQQEEQQPQVAKRRKRNSTVSLTPGSSSLHSPGIDMKDWIKVADSSKRNKLPNLRSPYSPPTTGSGPNHSFVEYSVADAGVGRRASDSPVSSDERITRSRRLTASYSPVGQSTQESNTLKHARKTILRPMRPRYEDRAVQTDPVGEPIPWWSPAAVKAPPRPPRLPLRKQLMQSFLRDREEAAATVLEDKKRKLDAVSGDPENIPSPKATKLSNNGSARRTTISPSLNAKGSLDVSLLAANLPAPDTSSLLSQTLITPDVPVTMVDTSGAKSPLSPRPPGPALADLFSADSDKPSSAQSSSAHERRSSEKTRANLPQDKPRVNGYRNPSLFVQLPPRFGTANGLLTPALQSLLPSAPTSASTQPSLAIFPNYVNPSVSALNSSMVSPSPTKTKKLSLEDYGKRKHKTDPVEKSDEKLSAKATVEGPATPTNLSKPPVISLVDEPASIADPTPSTLSIVTAPPPPAINSSKLATEPVIFPPPAPKDQRTTSLGSSVH